MSIKAAILATTLSAMIEVESDNVPAGVFVKKLNIGEREVYANNIKKAKKNAVNATAFCLIAYDEQGQPIFTLADVDEVNKLPADLVLDVIEKFNKENGFTDKDKNAVDEAEKN